MMSTLQISMDQPVIRLYTLMLLTIPLKNIVSLKKWGSVFISTTMLKHEII